LQKTHYAVITACGLGGGGAQLYQKAFKNIQPGSEKQFFLVAIMVRKQTKGNASFVRDFLEGGFHIPAFAKKVFGGLQQRFFLVFVHHGFCWVRVRHKEFPCVDPMTHPMTKVKICVGLL